MSAAIFCSVIFGLGATLVLTAQPHGRPRVSLAARLRALSPEVVEEVLAPRDRVFRTSIFEDGLRPLIENLGQKLASVTSRFGFDLVETSRRLRMAGDPGGLSLFLGQKLAAGLLGLALPTAAASLAPFIPRSAWLSLLMGITGFIAPDLMLKSKSEARGVDLREGMARFADLLALAVSAGMGLEAAIEETSRSSNGAFFDEFRTHLKEARLSNRPPSSAIARMATELGLTEAEPLAAALSSAESHGVSVMQVLSTQAYALRDKRRLQLLEASQRAEVRMRLVIGLLILPAFFIVIMYPAAVQLLQLTAR